MNKSKREEVSKEVQGWLREEPLFLDTETTGLGPNDEIVQIAIVDMRGQVLVDQLVKPVRSIPLDATAIHGITNEMVADCPNWLEVWDNKLREIVTGRFVVIYNAAYDTRMMFQTFRAFGGLEIWPRDIFSFKCAMEAYAEYYGEWNDYHGSYRWQRLGHACQQQDISTGDIAAHRAAGDCEMTRRLCLAMAQHSEVIA